MSIIQFPVSRRIPAAFSFPPVRIPSATPVKRLDMLTMFSRTGPAAPGPEQPEAAAQEPKELPKMEVIRRGNAALKRLTGFIGGSQLPTVKNALRGEEGQWFMEKLEELAGIVESMPVTYGQDGKGDDAIVYLHYFVGSYDGYITEKDAEKRDPGEAQWRAYGYARFAHMPECAESGYICLPEIFQSHAELDFHFKPCTLREIKRKHGVIVDEAPAAGDCLNSDSDDDHADKRHLITAPPASTAPKDPQSDKLHIYIERAEGYSEECKPYYYDSFALAWQCMQALGNTAPKDGGYDKTDVCVTFPDGKQWGYRYDLTHGGHDSGDGLDFAANLKQRLDFYAGRWTPEWMTAKGRVNPNTDKPDAEAVAILDSWGDTIKLTPPAPAATQALLPLAVDTPPAPNPVRGIFGHWETLSEQVPAGTILFVQLGDFYETFAHHAKTAAPLLQVALTKRNGVPMCGIPVHAEKSYFDRLLAKDMNVAIARKDTEGVQRIERILTPPTAAKADPLTTRQQKFLAMDDGYQAGAIISYSWGHEQTNYNFYRIEKRAGEWVTLIPLVSQSTATGDMHSDEFPTDTPKDPAKDHDPMWSSREASIKRPTFRKKIALRDGKPIGFALGSGLGWARLWKGTAEKATHYA